MKILASTLMLGLMLFYGNHASAKSASPLMAEILWENAEEGTIAVRIPTKAEYAPVYVEIVYPIQNPAFIGRIAAQGVCEIMQAKGKTFIKVGVFVDGAKAKERLTWVELGGPATVTISKRGL